MRGLNNEKRYALLDSLRGLLLLEMIVYHFFWDLVYLFEQDLPWFHSSLCYWWQQSICWRFIFLSGFCWPLGKRAVRRAVQVFGGSALVMVITHIFVPDQAVTFGVLFFLGSGMLLLKLLDRLLCRLAPVWGITASGMLFFLTRNINDGYLGFEEWNFFKIPEQLYLAGYYCLRFCETLGGLPQIFDYGSGCLSFFGRRSLLVYLLHQPLLYLLLTLILGGKVLL